MNSSSLTAVELLAKALAKLSVSYLFFLNYVILCFYSLNFIFHRHLPYYVVADCISAGLYRDKE